VKGRLATWFAARTPVRWLAPGTGCAEVEFGARVLLVGFAAGRIVLLAERGRDD
jgi:hypothetical protein